MNMENLEQSEKIIDLGKMLVKELDLQPGVDTLARWISSLARGKNSPGRSIVAGR